MNKRQKTKAIILELLRKTNRINGFSKWEIENAIQVSVYAVDKRTIQNWFDLLWKLEVLTQPVQGKYNLDWARITELEVPIPNEIDPRQKRLDDV